jgi:hypothetical protein
MPHGLLGVEIDFDSKIPTVKIKALEGKNSTAGDPVQALTLTVDKCAESYQVQVGNGVPNMGARRTHRLVPPNIEVWMPTARSIGCRR